MGRMGLQSFVLLLKLTVSLDFWPRKKKKKQQNHKLKKSIGVGRRQLGLKPSRQWQARESPSCRGGAWPRMPREQTELPEQGRHPGS